MRSIRFLNWQPGMLRLEGLLWPLFLLYLYLFPNGRAVPRWNRWPMGIILGLHFMLMVAGVLLQFEISSLPLSSFESLFPIVILVGFPLVVVSQVLRYRSYSSPIERQQTKWFVWCVASYAIISAIIGLFSGTC